MIIHRVFSKFPPNPMRRSGLVVERQTLEREVRGSILTQVAVLCP